MESIISNFTFELEEDLTIEQAFLIHDSCSSVCFGYRTLFKSIFVWSNPLVVAMTQFPVRESILNHIICILC
jgi:hypothetical protein